LNKSKQAKQKDKEIKEKEKDSRKKQKEDQKLTHPHFTDFKKANEVFI